MATSQPLGAGLPDPFTTGAPRVARRSYAVPLVVAVTGHRDLLPAELPRIRDRVREFLRELRAAGNKTPFGFVTSESNPAMREQAIEAGAQFLLCKPFNADQFEEIVGSVVR